MGPLSSAPFQSQLWDSEINFSDDPDLSHNQPSDNILCFLALWDGKKRIFMVRKELGNR